MIHLEFSPETIEQLQYLKRHHPHPYVRKKMEALFLKSQGMPHHQICQIVGIGGRATLIRYLRDYEKGGLDQVQKLNFRKPESELESHRSTIESLIAERPPATINEIRHRIEQATGIKRSNTAVNRFLKKTSV
jgi:transposase